MQGLELALKTKIDAEQKILNDLKIKIEKLIKEELPPDDNGKMIAQLKLLGHKVVPCTFETLAGLFARGDREEYAKHLPFLTADNHQDLHNLLGDYFLHATDLQLYQKARNAVLKAAKQIAGQKTEDKINETLHICGELLAARRTFKPEEWPAFMIFEFFSGFNLRKEQSDDMKTLLARDLAGGFQSKILQRIMSAGKTVVYGTLLAFMKADGYHLSILLPPASLFETNAQDMLHRSQTYFGQKGHVITFKRGPDYVSEKFLRKLRCLLVNAIRRREYIMMTPETLQSIQNSYIECLEKLAKLKQSFNIIKTDLSNAQNVEYEKRISNIEACKNELKHILLLIKERGAATFDEVDMTGSPRKELNFPTDEVDHLDRLGVTLVSELFFIAATDPKIKSAGLDLNSNTQARLPPSSYDQIKRVLAESIVQTITSTPQLTADLCLPPAFDEQNKKDLIEFFTNKDTDPPEWVRVLHQSQNKRDSDAAENLILIKKQIVDWLPDAWKKTADEHYGRSKQYPHIQVAKPYIAASIPNERAEISDRWEVVNKTCQLYLTNGLDKQQTKRFVMNLCEKASREWNETGCKIGLRQTKACIQFAAAFKNESGERFDLFSVDVDSQSVIKSIQEQLRNGSQESVRFILDFLRDQVFPEHEIFVEQITNNQQNAAGAVKSFQGYSGTLENPYIFHHSIVGNKENIIPDVGSNGRVIDVLLGRNQKVHTLSSEKITACQLMHRLLDGKSSKERNRFHALIDMGVFFKGYSNDTVASSLLEYFSSVKDSPIEGILYYDTEKNELAFLRKGSDKPIFLPATDAETIRSVTGLKQEQIFTYYDHLHTTGSNIPQPDTAAAIATINESATLRDILQGVMRMRKLLEKQNVEFVVPETMLPYLEEYLGIKMRAISPECLAIPDMEEFRSMTAWDPVTIDLLLKYAETKGYEQEEDDNIRVSYQKMYDQVSSFIRNKYYNETNSEKETALYNLTKSLFKRSSKVNLFKKFGVRQGKESSLLILNRLRDALCSILNSAKDFIEPAQIESVRSSLNDIIKLALERVPGELPGDISESAERTDTVEHLQEIKKQRDNRHELEMQQLQEQVVLKQREDPAIEKSWNLGSKLDASILACIPYPQTNEKNPGIWTVSDFMQGNAGYAKYAGCFDREIQLTDNFVSTRQKGYDLFSGFAKTPYQMLLVKDHTTQKYRLILLSLLDASSFEKALSSQGDIGSDPIWLIEDDGNVIAGPTDQLTKDAQLEGLLVQAQFLAGSWQSLSSQEWTPAVHKWLAKRTHDKRNLFENAILKTAQRAKYRESGLEKLLRDNGDNSPDDAGESLMDSAAMAASQNKLLIARQIVEQIPNEKYMSHPQLIPQALRVARAFLGSTDEDHAAWGSELLQHVIAASRSRGILGDVSVWQVMDENIPVRILEQLREICFKFISEKPELAIDIARYALSLKALTIYGKTPRDGIYFRINFVFEMMLKLGTHDACRQIAELYNASEGELIGKDFKSILESLTKMPGADQNQHLAEIKKGLEQYVYKKS